MAAYLSHLPAGMSSYPQCEARASVLNHQLRRRPLHTAGKGALPARIEQLAADPPPNSTWIREVELLASNLAIADHYRMSDAEYEAYAYDSNKALFESVVYRFAMSLLSPQHLLAAGVRVWSSIHRGVRFAVRPLGEAEYEFTLSYPPQLLEQLELRAFARSFLAVIEMSHVHEPRVELASFDEVRAQYRARWS